ncbi:MAG: Serine/threonine-protein kinase pkn5 [Verrucomicrobia bacterium ADurb.Bin345]|nr:MAG: Serine/threonine-protein kinase pkn5 [Verrucomicrobia bacterium ADurb.Bin345]
MNSARKHFETTRIEHFATTAVTETSSLEDTPSEAFGKGSQQLAANYQAIINARGIYYPVAYRFLKELGRGRQGIVFLGLRQGARGCVTRHAIKLFNPAIYPSAKKYWTDMGRIAAQTSKLQMVKSPVLVSPEIYEESNGIGYLQMEVVDGCSLRYLLDGEHLETVRKRSTTSDWARFTDAIFRVDAGRVRIQPGVALYIMRQILRGLETLHEMGFAHSDVKPANVMVDRLGYVKLIDFGRAVLLNEKVTILLGTPLYMAPETHRREPSVVQSDIYSVGLVGLEMLRGEPLLDTKGLSEADLLSFKNELPGRLPSLLPEYVRQNAQFVLLLQRFLEVDPKQRYASAEEAEVGSQGLLLVHKQLAQLGKDTEYGRELESYLGKLMAPLPAAPTLNQGPWSEG